MARDHNQEQQQHFQPKSGGITKEEEEKKTMKRSTSTIESLGHDTRPGYPNHVTRQRERLQSNDEYNYFISKGEQLISKPSTTTNDESTSKGANTSTVSDDESTSKGADR